MPPGATFAALHTPSVAENDIGAGDDDGLGDKVGLGEGGVGAFRRQGGSALSQVGTLLEGLRIPPMQQRVLCMRDRCPQLVPPQVPHTARQHARPEATPVAQRLSDRRGDGEGETGLAERIHGGPASEQDGTLCTGLRMPLGQQRVFKARLR